MSDREPVIAVDLGGTNLRVALVDDDKVISRVMVPTPRGAEAIVETIAKQAMELGGNNVEGVAIAAPGTASPKLGGLTKAPNLPELNGYPMAAQVTRITSLPCIVENDANAYAVGETIYGAARGYRSVVVYTLGTGVGGGIILGGKLWRGANGAAAEIGHVAIEENGRRCGCGALGCVEAYSSAGSMGRLAKEYGSKATTAREAYDLAIEGEEAAQKAFERAGTALGTAMAGMINILNPETIVIGGGGSSAFALLEPHIRKVLSVRAFPVSLEKLKLLKCTLGNDAGLLGAAALMHDLA